MVDLVIGVGIAGAVAAVIIKKVRDMKAGKSGCGCGCGCSGCSGCAGSGSGEEKRNS